MIEAALITLYGLALLGGLFMAYVWGHVAFRARRDGGFDQYCIIAIGLFLGAISNIILFGSATVEALWRGVSPGVLNAPRIPFIIGGLLVMGVSKWMLMFAHDMNAECRSWRWFVATSVIWIAVAPSFLMWKAL